MRAQQSKLTDFITKFQPKALPKKVLLKSSGIRGLLAEQIEEGRINLFVESGGRQKLIAILDAEQYKALTSIPILELCPNRLGEILPKVAQQDILLLNEGLIKIYRERESESSAKIFQPL